MTRDGIAFAVAGGVARLTLDRPEARNAIAGLPMIDAFVAACEAAVRDPDARVLVLTGAGRAFCAGGDVKDMRDRAGIMAGTSEELRRAYATGIQRMTRALYTLELPVVAAVNGAAIGLGCDLACMADVRVASEEATFAESFVRLGLVPGDGGAWLLQRAVGYAKAAEMTLTGEAIGAREALACGLVSRVVPASELAAAADGIAASIAAQPPHATRMAKRLLREAQQGTLETSLALAAAFQGIAQRTDDHGEAVAAMLERREPRFEGR